MKTHTILLLAILSILVGCSSPENKSATQQQTPSQPAEISDNGNNLFEEKCAACHGADGTAGIANAANLQISKLDTISVIRMITHGKSTMPAFAEQLDTGEIKQITNYVFNLRK
ncbi:MAG: cytochrome c [Bacteroidetes bacterium]|nr:cytochrome c [Bacteroidota bacterium]